ncbi:MAG: DNA repair protein RecN, partial [Candidatus Rokuibacteriota bacterium]
MLRELRVRNLAVIESVTVPFAAGLNVLSGETGAGKSILVDAVLLLRGGRVQADVIRAQADSALIEGLFEVGAGSVAGQILAEAAVASDDGQIVLRRELSRSGRHRAFVNDSPVTVGLLERLGDSLLEVHGQHEHQQLLQAGQQLGLLDRFAGTEEQAGRVAALYGKHRAAREELEGTRAAERDRAQREDLLRFQVSELEAARLRLGEEDELRVERRRLQSVERLLSGLTEVEMQLDDDRDSALGRVARAARGLRDLGRLDPALTAPADTLESASVLLEEALRAVRLSRAATAAEPGRLAAIEERLDALTRLKRKYGDSETAMLAFGDAAAHELNRLARHDEVVMEQERLLAEVQAELEAMATELTDRRLVAARRLQTLVEREIRTLGMERGIFRIALEPSGLSGITPRGWD